MRVRLIKPVLLEIAQLDTAATKASGGYDPDFGAVRVATKDGKRISERKEKAPIRLRGQFEDQTQNALRLFGAGNSPEAKVATTFEYRDLEEQKLIDPDSKLPLINVNDRLRAVYSIDGELVMAFRNRGLYAVEVRPASIGLDRKAGIVIVRWNDRALSEAPG